MDGDGARRGRCRGETAEGLQVTAGAHTPQPDAAMTCISALRARVALAVPVVPWRRRAFGRISPM